MGKKVKIGCAIPCYKGNKNIIEIIDTALKFVDLVVLVDDKCPLKQA